MILSCSRISKAFGSGEVLRDVSFHLEDQEKAALVGINGAGKTTLLKIITGELEADSGTCTLAKGRTFGYLSQHEDLDTERSVYEELKETVRPILLMEEQLRQLEAAMKDAAGDRLQQMLASYDRLNHDFEMAGGYAIRSELAGVLKGLGFQEDQFSTRISTLSGGQKTRVALGRLLLTKPDLIMLDEPTNHLDLDSVAWLETYLKNYRGAVLIVSHDRYFLNRVSGKIIELERGVSTVFAGTYDDYSEKKAKLRADQMKAYLNQQQEIRHQEEVITKLKSFNREKSIKRAESRRKQLARVELLEKPAELDDAMRLSLAPHIISGNDVLSIRGLKKAFGDLLLFSDTDIEIKRGEHVAVIGSNGTGKTTLLKLINGLLAADAGTIMLGANVHIGYYDQEHHVLNAEKTIFEEISDTRPDMTNTQIRSHLAAFLFTGDDVFKRIADLSGGERGRVTLAKLMLSEANFLILDEPTNHLDITSREILEDALNRYTGTVLCVSHDRYFINRTATRILELSGRAFTGYAGNYDYYLEKKEERETLRLKGAAQTGRAAEKAAAVQKSAAAGDGGEGSTAGSRQDWMNRKEEQARIRRRQNSLKRTEEEIARLEARDREIDGLLTREDVFTDGKRLLELTEEKQAIARQLEALYEAWEELADG